MIQDLVYQMRSYNYEPNSLVVKRGESSDCIYFLKQGTIFIEMPLKTHANLTLKAQEH